MIEGLFLMGYIAEGLRQSASSNFKEIALETITAGSIINDHIILIN